MRITPEAAARWRERFGLRGIDPHSQSSISPVHFAETSAGDAVVVKASDNHWQLANEVESLRAFGPARAAGVRDVSIEDGAVVLERVTPGVTLAASAGGEDEAMRVVAELFAAGWPARPPGAMSFPLDEWVAPIEYARAGWTGDVGRLAHASVTRASRLLDGVFASDTPWVMLHADLHYGNILTSNRAGHLLIDPKGVIGDPAFDVGYLVSRPAPRPSDDLTLGQRIDRRLAFLPDATGLDRHRVAACAYVAAVLSALWALEDGESPDAFCEAIEILGAVAP